MWTRNRGITEVNLTLESLPLVAEASLNLLLRIDTLCASVLEWPTDASARIELLGALNEVADMFERLAPDAPDLTSIIGHAAVQADIVRTRIEINRNKMASDAFAIASIDFAVRELRTNLSALRDAIRDR
jgi:hypothetical protein